MGSPCPDPWGLPLALLLGSLLLGRVVSQGLSTPSGVSVLQHRVPLGTR